MWHARAHDGLVTLFSLSLFPPSGGSRKDPLNLNALIEKKKALSAAAEHDNATDGNDRPVEILLQPDIFDPLRLDTGSRNDDELNNLHSVASNSTENQLASNPVTYTSRKHRHAKKRKHLPPPRYGNFQGYYGYRQPSHDQRLQYLQRDWFHDKQVLDIGTYTVTGVMHSHPPNIHMMNNQLHHLSTEPQRADFFVLMNRRAELRLLASSRRRSYVHVTHV